MSLGEIKRFVERFGLPQLLDTESSAYTAAGLEYLKLSEAQLLERIEREPKLLCLPLVRCDNRLSIGRDEAGWKAMLEGMKS
jgi:arsenate reductase-like glutaredoxin family protein